MNKRQLANQKRKETLFKKYGADYFSKIGSTGGKNSRGYSFAHGKVSPSEVGKKGGESNARRFKVK